MKLVIPVWVDLRGTAVVWMLLWELLLQSFGTAGWPSSGPAAPLPFQGRFDTAPCGTWQPLELCQPSSCLRKPSAGTTARGRSGIPVSEVCLKGLCCLWKRVVLVWCSPQIPGMVLLPSGPLQRYHPHG